MINYFKRKKQLNKIHSDIENLCFYKKILKSIGSFSEGLKFINKQFDMTEYVLNNLNRSLTDYSGVQNSLYECINLLHSYQDSYNKERRIQTI